MRRFFLLISITTLCSGCSSVRTSRPSLSGYFFTHTRIPYTLDLHNTPVGSMTGNGKTLKVKEPVSGYGVSAEFSTNAIGDIARKHGIVRVFFADLEVFDILGIWREKMLHISGEGALDQVAANQDTGQE